MKCDMVEKMACDYGSCCRTIVKKQGQLHTCDKTDMQTIENQKFGHKHFVLYQSGLPHLLVPITWEMQLIEIHNIKSMLQVKVSRHILHSSASDPNG